MTNNKFLSYYHASYSSHLLLHCPALIPWLCWCWRGGARTGVTRRDGSPPPLIAMHHVHCLKYCSSSSFPLFQPHSSFISTTIFAFTEIFMSIYFCSHNNKVNDVKILFFLLLIIPLAPGYLSRS